MDYKQLTDCTEWQFKNIPEFKCGKLNTLFADCGTGLNNLPDDETADNSFMHIVNDVSAAQTAEYAEKLAEKGLKKVFENKLNGNLFYQFVCSEGLLYIYHSKPYKEARIILDRCRQSSVCDFGTKTFEAKHGDTLFAQYSLHYDSMIKGTTCDCGMNYVYRLSDNSLIIIDGGEMEQATDIAVKDYMDFLHEITNTTNGKKITISLWICTHAHNDHCDFFSKMLRFYSEELNVKRAAFNFPADSNTSHSKSVILLKQRLLEKFPDIKYIKFHTGTKFSIAEAEITVLSVNEDTIARNPERIFPGMNDTSSIFTVEANGIKTLFLADCGDGNGRTLVDNCSGLLNCNFVQAAHHGINEIFEVYDNIKAEKVLLPQCRMNMETRFDGIFANYASKYGEENILLANDKTYIFTFSNGEITESSRPHCVVAYDGSEW